MSVRTIHPGGRRRLTAAMAVPDNGAFPREVPWSSSEAPLAPRSAAMSFEIDARCRRGGRERTEYGWNWSER